MKKRATLLMFLLALLSFSLLLPGPALKAQMLTDIYNGSRGQNFNDGWKFNPGDVKGAEQAGFNDAAWQDLDLPHDWSIYSIENLFNGGIGWYRKTFSLPPEIAEKRVFVQFDGIYMNSEVWINGNYLGVYPYGYTSFEYELTPYLNFGGKVNVLAVKVNNQTPNSRWYSGSGIYRNVWLTVTDPVHVAYCGVFVKTPAVTRESADVEISTRIWNQSADNRPVSLTASILDARGKTVASGATFLADVGAGKEFTFNQKMTVAKPRLWSVDSPYLYTVKVEVIVNGKVVDTYKASMGIRTIKMHPDTGFYLNGVNMKLQGVCMHHDLGSLGAAINYRAMERQMEIMKAMGCNAIRTAHNPPAPELLEICDRLGLLVIDEAFDCWRKSKTKYDYHLYFNDWAERDIKAMVRRDRNHPCVIMWSIGNEILDTYEGGLEDSQKLIAWVRQEDNTRAVTIGSNSMWSESSQKIAGMLDAVGYNYGDILYDRHHSEHPDWVIYGSEVSSAVRSRGIYHLPLIPAKGKERFILLKKMLTHPDHQCSSYDNSIVSWGLSAEEAWMKDRDRKFVMGQFVWTGFDYLGEPTPYEWPSKNSYFGIVDTCGFPKDIYYFYQSQWTDKPMVHILPHWNWKEGETLPVLAYTNCDSVELFLNGKSLGVKTFDPKGPLHLAWDVPFEPGTLKAVARKGNRIAAMHVVKTAGEPARIQLKADRKKIKADGKDLVFIETSILDAKGNFVPTATNLVNFTVSGPGKLVGVDNGDSTCHESYKGSSRSAFSGKCLAIIQSTGEKGRITITATSEGLSKGTITVSSN